MSTHDDLSSLPPATLRAALNASEKRIQWEKEKIQREIRKLQKKLEELDEGPDSTPDIDLERNLGGGSERKAKRSRIDSPSDDDEPLNEKYNRWPIARARKVEPGPVSPQRYVCALEVRHSW